MNKRDQDRIIYDNIAAQVMPQIKDMSKEELQAVILQMSYKLNYTTEKNRLMKNAMFNAKSEHFQGRLFDPNTLEVPENYDDFLQKQIEQHQKQRIEDLELSIDDLNKKLKTAKDIQKRKSLESLKEKDKKAVNKKEKIDEVIVYESEEKVCPHCQEDLVVTGEKVSYLVEMIPCKIKVIKQVFVTKTCPNKCTDEDGSQIFYTPERPERLIENSPATPSLVAGLAYEKFELGLPLYRLEGHFKKTGVGYSRQTMSNNLIACSEMYLSLIWEKMRSDLRKCEIIHMDETSLKCLEFRNERKKSYMLAAVTGDGIDPQMVVYQFSKTYKQTFVSDMIGPDFQGVLMTDGLQAYANYPQAVKLNCMAHARRETLNALDCRDDYRKLEKTESLEARTNQLASNPSLNILLDAMNGYQDLYQVESNYYGWPAAEVRQARQDISKPIFNRMISTMTEIQEGFPDGSQAVKAAEYFLSRKDTLSRYMEDGRYPIDNNKAERAVKPFVMARKNFLFANTEAGAESAAVYMTLLESAGMNGLNPLAYLTYVLETARTTRLDDETIEKLLPYSKDLPEELKL